MPQLHGHGTLVVAQYTSEGIAVAADSLQNTTDVAGTTPSKSEVRKLFRTDKRTACALADLSGCTKPDGTWVDFGEAVNRGAVRVKQNPRGLSFQDKCDVVASELGTLLQDLSNAVAAYPKQTVSTLFFFGYQGRSAMFGVRQFDHEGENIFLKHYSRAVTDSELWILGPSKTIKVRLAKMGIGSKLVEKAVIFPIHISSVTEAISFVRSLVSESIEAEPEILGRPVWVATIPRDPKMEPTLTECR